jgi:glycosyltransferase involved in cell wall biosynthesis
MIDQSPGPHPPLGPARRDPRTLPSVSVVVPAYNEASIIAESPERIYEYLRTLDGAFRWEIIVVDDGSTDETRRIADDFAASRPEVRVLHHTVNFNLGQALRYAFSQSTSDYLVTLDCDLSYSPDHIGRLLTTIEDTGARIVIASPYLKGGETVNVPLVRRIASRVANRILARTSRGGLSTLTGMVRAYDRRFLSSLDLKAMDSEINVEIVYKAQLLRGRIVEIPATLDWSSQRDRKAERKSSIKMSRSTTSSVLMSFYFHPLLFFIVPGLFLFALSSWMILWAFIRVVQNYVAGSGAWDPRLSDALNKAYNEGAYQFVVGGVAMLLSAQLLALGIVSLQAKRYFEELFHLGSSIFRRLSVPEIDAE